MNPELIAYAKRIVSERGIPKERMTPEIMGEVLCEARRRMEKTVAKYLESPQAQTALAKSLYDSLG